MLKRINKYLLLLMAAIIAINTLVYRQQDVLFFGIYLFIALLVLGSAWAFYGFLKTGCEKLFTWDMKRLLTVFSVLAALGIAFWTTVVYTEGFYLFTEQNHQKWVFEAMVVILFPVLCTWIGEIMKHDAGMENKIAASAVIVTFQLFAFILFRPLGTVWLLWMILLGVTTVWNMVFAVSEVTNNTDVERKMRWVFLYLFFWLGMYFMFGLDFEVDYQRLAGGIQKIQGGYLTYIYIVLLTLFAQKMTSYLGREHKKNKSMYLVQQAAYLNLMLRVIFGLMYWMGISPIPIRPPFASLYAVIMDSVCVAILAQSECENIELVLTEFDDFDEFEEEGEFPFN